MENKLYIYKILSQKDWAESNSLGYLKLQAQDDKFIHLAEKDQIDRIVKKFWSGQQDILIAKIDSSKIIGRLIKEANPGGTNTYYHLYDGKIPLKAVTDIFPYKYQG